MLDDFQDVPLLLFPAGRGHQGPDRRGVRASFSDDLAQVLLRDPQFEHVRVLSHDLLDLDLFWFVDQGLDDRHDELLHKSLRFAPIGLGNWLWAQRPRDARVATSAATFPVPSQCNPPGH